MDPLPLLFFGLVGWLACAAMFFVAGVYLVAAGPTRRDRLAGLTAICGAISGSIALWGLVALTVTAK